MPWLAGAAVGGGAAAGGVTAAGVGGAAATGALGAGLGGAAASAAPVAGSALAASQGALGGLGGSGSILGSAAAKAATAAPASLLPTGVGAMPVAGMPVNMIAPSSVSSLPTFTYAPAGTGITGAASTAPATSPTLLGHASNLMKEYKPQIDQAKELYDMVAPPKSGGVPGQQGSPARLVQPGRAQSTDFSKLPPEVQAMLKRMLQ